MYDNQQLHNLITGIREIINYSLPDIEGQISKALKRADRDALAYALQRVANYAAILDETASEAIDELNATSETEE